MRDALIVHTPFTDFTRPPIDLALLKSACAGRDVRCVDLNLAAFGELTSEQRVADMVATGEARVSALVKRSSLGFWEQQELAQLAQALADGIRAKDFIAEAVEVFRDAERFYTRDGYQQAVKATEAALTLASALAFPFHLSIGGLGAPFSTFSEQAVARFRAVDPFRSVNEKLVADADSKAVVLVLAECAQFLPACALAALLREKRPDTRVIACGPWIEQAAVAEGEKQAQVDQLLHAFFDAVITTDPERLLPELLTELDKPKLHAGVSFAERVGASGKAKAHAPLDLDKLAPPDFSDLTLQAYPSPEPVLTFRASRGRCICRATGNWWGLTLKSSEVRRVLSPTRAAEQVRAMAQTHEARLVILNGDLYETSWLGDFAQALTDAGGGVRWCAEALLDQPLDNAERLKAGGCVSLTFGVQEHRHKLDILGRATEALAHVGIAVQVTTSLAFPSESEDQAREALAVLKSHHQEIDLVNVLEHDPGVRVSVDPRAFGASATWMNGDTLGLFPDYPRLAGMAKERVSGELDRTTQAYAVKRQPFAGAVGAPHTLLGFDRFGRRVFSTAQRPQQVQAVRPLSDGDRVRLSESAKMLWIPYQLSVFGEIASEENELREHDLVRRHKDIGADRVWTYSSREDLKLRAQQRTPHVLGPGMPVTEIGFALADLLAHIGEQFLPVSQLLAKAPREMKDALRRQLQQLFAHGALVSEAQARHHAPQGQGQGSGAPGQGQGRRRRRRRRGRGAGMPQQPSPQQ